MGKAYLGLDIGTTKAAAVVYDPSEGKLLAAASAPCKADADADSEGAHEQDPGKIFETLANVVEKLPQEARDKVEGIGATGQMHGVLLASADGCLSPLVTWKDRRASMDGSLKDILGKPGCEGLRDGFGFTTLAWMARRKALDDASWSSASTIHDALVAQLCGLERPVCDYADAASWGLFDIFKNEWDMEAVDALRIPRRLLPKLLAPGSIAGALQADWAKVLGLKQGIPVAAATGDNQASILATAQDPAKEIYLTVGTGAQLSIAVNPEEAEEHDAAEGMELRPFFDGRLLAVAAPLCGGESFAWLVKSIKKTFADFGAEAPDDAELYQRLDELAMRSTESGLRFKPNFIGERNQHALRASIEGIGLENFDAGTLAASLAEGLMLNMKSMMAPWAFEGRERIVASGNAMRKLSTMRHQARKAFKLPLTIPESQEEAACGAAILAAKALR